MKLNQNEKQFILANYQNGADVEDIAFHVGINKQAVKRALADMRAIDLSWYKTDEQHKMLTRLNELGISDLASLNSKLAQHTVAQTNPLV